MAYQVVLADSAKADTELIFEWVVEQSPVHGPAWFDELIESLFSLERFPQRCPIAREAAEAKRGIRCLVFGRRHGVYRILFEVDDESQTVRILHIRHGARRDLPLEELR